MNDTDLELLRSLPPEVLQQLMELGGAGDKMSLEQQRMKMGQQLAQPQSGPHSTAGGALGGGIADIIRGGAGGLLQGQGVVNQQKLLEGQQAGRNAYAKSISDFLRMRNQTPAMGASDATMEPLV